MTGNSSIIHTRSQLVLHFFQQMSPCFFLLELLCEVFMLWFDRLRKTLKRYSVPNKKDYPLEVKQRVYPWKIGWLDFDPASFWGTFVTFQGSPLAVKNFAFGVSFWFTPSGVSPPADFTSYFWVVVSNIFYFHPYLGKIPNLTNIFQRGWNHQLDFHFGKSSTLLFTCNRKFRWPSRVWRTLLADFWKLPDAAIFRWNIIFTHRCAEGILYISTKGAIIITSAVCFESRKWPQDFCGHSYDSMAIIT